jgi:hypothetical protein
LSISIPRNQPLILDTNVAVLLFVGMAGPELIGKHQRLGQFDMQDFKLLTEIASNASSLAVSPYVAAEISNLALDRRNIGLTARQRIAAVMREQIAAAQEHYVTCAATVAEEKFDLLGMTDSALLSILKDNRRLNLLTDDHTLSQIGQSRRLRVYNFSHIRDQRDDFRP